jgi:zinc transport system substrate-binding protein
MGIVLILRKPRAGRRRLLRVFLAAAVLASVASACRPDTGGSSDGRLQVVASAYPLAEAAARVGGDLVDVRNLTPPGVEPHDLELAPDDLETLLSADLVLYVGAGFQPAVEDAVGGASGAVVDVLDQASTLTLSQDGAGSGDAVDPHVWLDPKRFGGIVALIADRLVTLDPAGAAAFRANAATYEDELSTLDAGFRDGLASCSSRLLVVSHAAFGYLADAYGLTQVPIAGISPEAEPDPSRLADLKALVEREHVTTIFTEELASPKVAETLASEAGVTTAVLNPLEGLTQAQLDAGADYGSVMQRNLETLRGALGCS